MHGPATKIMDFFRPILSTRYLLKILPGIAANVTNDATHEHWFYKDNG